MKVFGNMLKCCIVNTRVVQGEITDLLCDLIGFNNVPKVLCLVLARMSAPEALHSQSSTMEFQSLLHPVCDHSNKCAMIGPATQIKGIMNPTGASA